MSQPIVGPAMEYATTRPSRGVGSLVNTRWRFGADSILRLLTTGSALIVITLLAALVAVILHASIPSIRSEGLRFLLISDWVPPHQGPAKDANGHSKIDEDGNTVMVEIPGGPYGALAVMYGTAVSSMLALVFAIPMSLGAALFLVRVSPRVLAGPISFLVEFLAAIPSIAYGMWGALVFSPFLQNYIEAPLGQLYVRAGEPRMFNWLFQGAVFRGGQYVMQPLALNGRDLLCGGFVLAIMVVPIITAISRDVLKSVPRSQIEGTVALGATWWQSSREMLRYSRAGLFGAIMLGLARAAGETMAVTMVIGNVTQIRSSIFAPLQTMSSLLANDFPDATDPLHRSALCEVALALLLMSLLFNVTARYLVVGRESRSARAA